jgi:nucleoside-diphosphate-sugar epimerase
MAGTQSIFESIAKTKGIKKVVLTSSIGAIYGRPPSGATITEECWNSVTYDQAVQICLAPTKTPEEQAAQALTIYVASKALQERFAWEFVETNHHPFELTAINPSYVVGPTVVPGFPAASGTNEAFWNTIISKPLPFPLEGIPLGYVGWVDIRDVALAHVRALITPASNGKRFLAVSSQPTDSEIVQLAIKHFPNLDVPVKDEKQSKEGWDTMDASALTRVLGIKYITLEQTVIDFVAQVFSYKEPS